MKRLRRSAIPAVAFVFLAACGSSVNVTSDRSPTVDFSAFETFAWLPDGQSDGTSQATDQITDQRIRLAMESQLAERGLREVSSGADLMVGYQLTTRTNVSYRTTGTHWGRSGWGGWSGGVSTMRTVPVYSSAGTLLIRMYETEEKTLVWHGSGQADLRSFNDPEQRQERINDVVRSILSRFPPSN